VGTKTCPDVQWDQDPSDWFGENFLLLVCEVFRAHEMRSQLEVTEMLESKPYCVAPSFQGNTLLHSCGLYAWKWGLESV